MVVQFLEVHLDIVDHLVVEKNLCHYCFINRWPCFYRTNNGSTNAEVFLTLLGEALFLICDRAWENQAYLHINWIHFLSVRESYTHALPKNTKYLTIRRWPGLLSQTAFYRCC